MKLVNLQWLVLSAVAIAGRRHQKSKKDWIKLFSCFEENKCFELCGMNETCRTCKTNCHLENIPKNVKKCKRSCEDCPNHKNYDKDCKKCRKSCKKQIKLF